MSILNLGRRAHLYFNFEEDILREDMKFPRVGRLQVNIVLLVFKNAVTVPRKVYRPIEFPLRTLETNICFIIITK